MRLMAGTQCGRGKVAQSELEGSPETNDFGPRCQRTENFVGKPMEKF